MFDFSILKILFRELVTFDNLPRIPESDLVMDNLQEVAAYAQGTKTVQGEFAAINLFHMSHICEVIRDGDKVLDLACGPGGLLVNLAKLNPKVNFVGVDLSANMLTQAKQSQKELGLTNLEFYLGSMSDLSFLQDAHFDVVISTLALHHLSDFAALKTTFKEILRVLKSDGGMYLADFCRFKSERSILEMGHRRSSTQSQENTANYVQSLRASFSLDNFKEAGKVFCGRAKVFSTFLVPFVMVIKSQRRQVRNDVLRRDIVAMKENLPEYHKADLENLQLTFKLGGLTSSLL